MTKKEKAFHKKYQLDIKATQKEKARVKRKLKLRTYGDAK